VAFDGGPDAGEEDWDLIDAGFGGDGVALAMVSAVVFSPPRGKIEGVAGSGVGAETGIAHCFEAVVSSWCWLSSGAVTG
jgi:hypothetical protein